MTYRSWLPLRRSWRSLKRGLLCLQPAQIVVLAACTDDVEKDILKGRIFILAAGTAAQFLQGSLRHQYTLIDNAYTSTEALNDLHDMGGEKDGRTVLRQIVQNITNDPRTDR